jgi:hypothetical protein
VREKLLLHDGKTTRRNTDASKPALSNRHLILNIGAMIKKIRESLVGRNENQPVIY